MVGPDDTAEDRDENPCLPIVERARRPEEKHAEEHQPEQACGGSLNEELHISVLHHQT